MKTVDGESVPCVFIAPCTAADPQYLVGGAHAKATPLAQFIIVNIAF